MSRLTIFLLCLPALLQLSILGGFDLGVDEAHYMLYARHLDWSYFDHPPLVGWVHFLFNTVFGETLFSARLPAILAGLFVSWQLFRFLRDLGFSENASRWGAFAVSITFQFFVLNLFLLPETLCFVLVWPLMRALARVLDRNRVKDWVLLGLFLGLVGLSKYTAIFFVVPVALMIVSRQGFSFLKNRGFYLALLTGLILISPVLTWNFKNDWISFRYQLGHVVGAGGGIDSVLKSLALQVFLYSPVLWPFSFVGLWQLLKSSHVPARFALWTSLVFAGFFIWSSWSETVLPHWPALFYLFTISVGVATTLDRSRGWVATLVMLQASLVVMVCLTLWTGLAHAIPGALKEVGGWQQVMQMARERSVQNPEARFVFLNWTYGSRAKYYARKDLDPKVGILDRRQDQFDLWNQGESLEGRDVWVIQFDFDTQDFSELMTCSAKENPERQDVYVRGSLLFQVSFELCREAHLR